ncbi:hypothetical protein JOQ06_018336, partial [Pogonophryne albipinna]
MCHNGDRSSASGWWQRDSGDGDRQTDRRRGKERRRDDQKDCSHNDEASDWKDAVSIQFALINPWVVPCFDTGSPQFRTLGHAGFTEGETPAVIPAFPEKCGVSQGACGQCEGPCVGPLCQTQAIPGHNTPQPICVITATFSHSPDNGRAGPHLLTAPRLSQGVGLERRLGPPPHRSAAETRLGPNRINSNQHRFENNVFRDTHLLSPRDSAFPLSGLNTTAASGPGARHAPPLPKGCNDSHTGVLDSLESGYSGVTEQVQSAACLRV